MQQLTPRRKILPAGAVVGFAPYKRDGYPVMIAVASSGVCVAEVVLHRGLTPSRVRATLINIVLAVEPPRLSVLK